MTGDSLHFKTRIGLPLVTYIVIGLMVGGGIFVYTGIVYSYTGAALPLAYGLAVIPVFISMMPLAMMGSAMPLTGANYLYASRMVSPLLAFTGVWVYALASFFGQLPLYILGCTRYIQGIFPDVPALPLALGILTLIYLINLLGVKPAAQFQGILILVMLTALIVFISGGIPEIDTSRFQPLMEKGAGNLILGISLLTFTYFGANGIIEIGSEIKNPGKTIPRAFFIAFGVVTLLYVGVALVSVGTLNPDTITGIGEPLLEAARENLGKGWFHLFVIGGAVLALLTTLNSLFIIGTRSLLMIVHDRLLPAWLGKITKKGDVPARLLTLIYVLAVVGVISGFSLETFASYASLGGLVIFVPVLLAAWRFPKLHPDLYQNSPFFIRKGWLRLFILVGLAMVSFFGIIILYDMNSPGKIGLFLLFIFSGVGTYYLRMGFLKGASDGATEGASKGATEGASEGVSKGINQLPS